MSFGLVNDTTGFSRRQFVVFAIELTHGQVFNRLVFQRDEDDFF